MQRLASKLVARGVAVSFVSTAAQRDLPSQVGRAVPGLLRVPVVRIPTTRPALFDATARAWLAARGGADVLYAVGWNAALHAVRVGELGRVLDEPALASRLAAPSASATPTAG